jgi:hypothetical protein
MRIVLQFQPSIFLIIASKIIFVEGGRNPASETISRQAAPISEPRFTTSMSLLHTQKGNNFDIVFSDLDGTLIHYPSNLDEALRGERSHDFVVLPSSSTGMVGVISAKSLQLVREIRLKGVKFVLVSGMRASTLMKRLPYLPKSDAYCCENGGRIFYPTMVKSSGAFYVQPKMFNGATIDDLLPFYIVEDAIWRRMIEHSNVAGQSEVLGKDYFGSESPGLDVPLIERSGLLWKFASILTDQGLTVDGTGYSTCFRVNRQHQKDPALFESLINGVIEIPIGLSSSTNLGCVDFYPLLSGKKHWCVFSTSCV